MQQVGYEQFPLKHAYKDLFQGAMPRLQIIHPP
jgi:hypothetical protein